MEHCACGSLQRYSDCCGRFIDGKEWPSTPEELMRSRYTAYTRINIDYIARTMKPPAADHFDPEGARQWAESIQWIKLEVISRSHRDSVGYVEFLAYFNQNKKRHALHEQSEFHREQGIWYYVDGKAPKEVSSVKTSHIGRNERCPCGSGKKYKKCCGGVQPTVNQA